MERHRREGFSHMIGWAVSAFFMLLYTSWLDIRNRYDLIHVHNLPDFLVFSAITPRLRGCPVLLNVHDPTPELTRSKLRLPPEHILVRVQTLIENVCVAFSSHVITASPTFRNILISRGIPADKISVVMNAADPRYFKPDACGDSNRKEKNRGEPSRFALLYVGTVARRYGLETCVTALPLLKKHIPGVQLHVYPKIKDEGEALDSCLRLAERLGVGDLVSVHDPAPLEQMPQIMKAADLGVYPALRDCHMDIALSLKIPEMISVGLPVVSSRLSVLEDLYGDEAVAFVPSGDPEAFAARVIELYDNPKVRRELAQKALERSAALTWDTQYQMYWQVLESMLAKTALA
jgi:glycosyltransferase involved in cell wall biosynthesis